ncbi:MAG TPA: hypothetical protein VKM55_09435 [Candidatus Lokiarchaeia archaeon]|nr:hypothetical protein [Candidatus Lokiarchaeia archaeon]
MSTTIQISNDVQKKLFQFINQKEKELGHRITYNEAIQLLLEDQCQKMTKQDFIKHVERFQGILDIDDVTRARNEERKLEIERERKLRRY